MYSGMWEFWRDMGTTVQLMIHHVIYNCKNRLSTFFVGHHFFFESIPPVPKRTPNIKGPGSISNFWILLVVANLMFNFPLENIVNIKVQFEG